MLAVVGFTALSMAACGSSNTSSPSSSSTSTPAASASPSATSPGATPGAAAGGKDQVRGIVGTVSGGTVTVTEQSGSATVDVTPSTKVTQLTQGQLTDITAGECLMVNPTKDSGQPPAVTAAALLFGAPDNGQCGHPGGGPGGGPGGNAPGARLAGTVASVNGNSIVLTATDNSQTTVTVTPDTRYAKRVAADGSAITAGQCLAARGQKDNSGVLQATFVSVRPANNGQCGGGHQHN
jgi:hypothetical protein